MDRYSNNIAQKSNKLSTNKTKNGIPYDTHAPIHASVYKHSLVK